MKLKSLEAKVANTLESNLKKEGPKGTEDSTLTRAVGDATQEKYRCTYEARHVILHYADPTADEPVALNWKGAHVVKASVHARLHNIGDNSRWLEDEEYIYGGRKI